MNQFDYPMYGHVLRKYLPKRAPLKAQVRLPSAMSRMLTAVSNQTNNRQPHKDDLPLFEYDYYFRTGCDWISYNGTALGE